MRSSICIMSVLNIVYYLDLCFFTIFLVLSGHISDDIILPWIETSKCSFTKRNSFGRGIGRDSLVGKLTENVRNVVKGCSEQAHDSFEWWVLACTWMTAGRDESLGPPKAPRKLLRFISVVLKCCRESWHILFFFFLDML